MATTTYRLAAIPSLGTWTATGAGAVSNLSAIDGAYIQGGTTSAQMYGTAPLPAGITGAINSVTVRLVARLATPGLQDLGAALRPGGVSYYHPSPYAVTSDQWATYDLTWTTNPATGAPWTLANLQSFDRYYLRASGSNSRNTLIYVDSLEIIIDHAGDAPTNSSRTLADTAQATDHLTIATHQQLTLADVATITDGGTEQALTDDSQLGDVAQASDVLTVTMDAGLPLADQAAATDSLTLSLDAGLPLSDMATATDTLTITVTDDGTTGTVTVADAATGTDQLVISVQRGIRTDPITITGAIDNPLTITPTRRNLMGETTTTLLPGSIDFLTWTTNEPITAGVPVHASYDRGATWHPVIVEGVKLTLLTAHPAAVNPDPSAVVAPPSTSPVWFRLTEPPAAPIISAGTLYCPT